MRSGFVLRLHFAIEAILLACHFVLLVLLHLLQLVVEDYVVRKLIFVLGEQGMLDYVGEGHSFLAVHYEDSLEEIL